MQAVRHITCDVGSICVEDATLPRPHGLCVVGRHERLDRFGHASHKHIAVQQLDKAAVEKVRYGLNLLKA